MDRLEDDRHINQPKLIYKNKQLRWENGTLIAEWSEELTPAQIEIVQSGYSPLFFRDNLIKWFMSKDRGFLYGITPSMQQALKESE